MSLRLLAVNGGLTQANLQFTAQFFGPSGTKATDKAIPVSELADLSS